MGKKHATRNELAQAFLDMWLWLNFRVCGEKPVIDNPMYVNKSATREQLRREIIDARLQIYGLLRRYQELMQDEAELNNRRCAKNNAGFAG